MTTAIEPWEDRIYRWGDERDFYTESSPVGQFVKLVEEFAELRAGIARRSVEEVKDAIGDATVVMRHMCVYFRVDFRQAFEDSKFLPLESMDGDFVDMCTEADVLLILHERKAPPWEAEFPIKAIIGRLMISASEWHLNMSDCMEHAWEQIKDRNGHMKNEVFIKEA